DGFIACEFCGNDFNINHLGHWVTIQQRCPVCKEILSTEFISYLCEVSNSVAFDYELVEVFRRDLEIEEMQSRQKIANGQAISSATYPNPIYDKRYYKECGGPMVILLFRLSANQKFTSLTLNRSGSPILYCPKHKTTA
ncbi:MAG: hypothetical protein ACC656_01010, partial [Candidatus Heimdallarchaeota archaeon]